MGINLNNYYNINNKMDVSQLIAKSEGETSKKAAISLLLTDTKKPDENLKNFSEDTGIVWTIKPFQPVNQNTTRKTADVMQNMQKEIQELNENNQKQGEQIKFLNERNINLQHQLNQQLIRIKELEQLNSQVFLGKRKDWEKIEQNSRGFEINNENNNNQLIKNSNMSQTITIQNSRTIAVASFKNLQTIQANYFSSDHVTKQKGKEGIKLFVDTLNEFFSLSEFENFIHHASNKSYNGLIEIMDAFKLPTNFEKTTNLEIFFTSDGTHNFVALCNLIYSRYRENLCPKSSQSTQDTLELDPLTGYYINNIQHIIRIIRFKNVKIEPSPGKKKRSTKSQNMGSDSNTNDKKTSGTPNSVKKIRFKNVIVNSLPGEGVWQRTEKAQRAKNKPEGTKLDSNTNDKKNNDIPIYLA